MARARTTSNHTLVEAVEEARATYAAARPRSLAAFERSTEYMPGGNTRTVLFHGPYPLRVKSGEGATITDVDGHDYVNLLGEYTAGIYGHTDPVIQAAVHEALANGINLGAHNTYEVELARIVCGRFPSIEQVRFTNSGTEANLMAIATARHVTGRDKVFVFDGGYHGGLLYFGHGGIPINAPYPYVLGKYNDIDTTRALIREHGSELACVLVEPMLGAGGCIPGDADFLAMVREETRNAGVLMIFDEVMTSRLSGGGAQQLLGLHSDMTTLGKYIGGGMSFGAFGASAQIMGLYDPRKPGSMPHAGTFNNNVLTMAAGIAGLSELYTPEAAQRLSARGDELRATLNALFGRAGVRWQAVGLGSVIGLHPVAGAINTPDDLKGADDGRRELLFFDLLEAGYYMAQRGFIALNLALSEEQLAGFVEATERCLERRAGLYG